MLVCVFTLRKRMAKPTKRLWRPAKTQISLRIHTISSRSSMFAWRKIASMAIEDTSSEDSDQNARMRRLIWNLAVRTWRKVWHQENIPIQFWPLKPHFYIVKLGYTLFFLFLLKKHRLWYLLEPPRLAEAVLTSTHNLCFEQKYEKYRSFLSENFQFLKVKFSIYLNRRVFVMVSDMALVWLQYFWRMTF